MIKVAVLLGDAAEGITAHGPFSGFDAACRWGEKQNYDSGAHWATAVIGDPVHSDLYDENGRYVVAMGDVFNGGIALTGTFNYDGATEHFEGAVKQGPAVIVRLWSVIEEKRS